MGNGFSYSCFDLQVKVLSTFWGRASKSVTGVAAGSGSATPSYRVLGSNVTCSPNCSGYKIVFQTLCILQTDFLLCLRFFICVITLKTTATCLRTPVSEYMDFIITNSDGMRHRHATPLNMKLFACEVGDDQLPSQNEIEGENLTHPAQVKICFEVDGTTTQSIYQTISNYFYAAEI